VFNQRAACGEGAEAVPSPGATGHAWDRPRGAQKAKKPQHKLRETAEPGLRR